jgi:hypothetical protein
MFHPELMKALLRESVLQLESRPHAGFPGLRERYYYRGNFILLEALTPKAVAWNVARLHRKGEHEHADRLSEFAEVVAKGILADCPLALGLHLCEELAGPALGAASSLRTATGNVQSGSSVRVSHASSDKR